MNFNDTDFERLRNWEPHFKTMTESGFCRNIRAAEIEELDTIWNRNTGEHRRTNKNCGACIGGLVRLIAPAYFADKSERALIQASSTKVGKSSAKSVKPSKTTKK